MNIISICLLSCLLIAGDNLTTDDPTPWAHEGLGCMTDSECEQAGIAEDDEESIVECDEECMDENAQLFLQTDE